MTIPTYEEIMLPLLEYCKDDKEHSLQEGITYIAQFFKLTQEEKDKQLPSGQKILYNRVGWAKLYLKKAGLTEEPKRSYYKITQLGKDILERKPSEINNKYLEQFSDFIAFKNIKPDEVKQQETPRQEQTPQETLEYSYEKLRRELADELLKQVKTASPSFFEKLVVDLLLKMGYGGSRQEAGKAIGQSGDEGIDGVINEDKLGLDIIYIQAKRWEATIGRPEIQKFAGALQGKHANKGIFITTSSFSKEAFDYVAKIPVKIALIDGEQLAQLMIENNIAVSKTATYEIKKMDLDYFEED